MEEKISLDQTKEKHSRGKRNSTRGLDLIISISIYLIFFLTPIFFTGLVLQGLGFEKMILFFFLVLLGVVAWVTKGIVMGELDLKRTPMDVPILVLLASFTLSTFLSVDTKDSLIGSYSNTSKGLIALYVFTLFYYLIVNNLNSQRIKFIFWSFVTSSSLVFIFTLLQLQKIFLLPFSFTKIINFNPLGSFSSLTMFIVMSIPLVVVSIAQIKEIHPHLNNNIAIVLRIMLGISALSGFVVLALLNGFTFWPAAIIGAVIVLMFFLSKVIKITNNNLVIPIASFLLLIVLSVLSNFNITNLNLPPEVSLSRKASWSITKQSIKSDPFFGSGPSTFYYDFSKYKSLDFNSSPLWNVRFDSASGVFYELLSTVGILGTITFVVLLLVAISISFLALIKTNKKEIHSILLSLFAGSSVAMVLALLFSFSNALILMFVILSVFTVSVAVVSYPEKFATLKLSLRTSPKYALALAAIFLCVSAGVVILFTMGLKMYLADVYAKKALVASDVNKKISNLSQAVQLASYQDNYYVDLANNYMAMANKKALGAKEQTEVQSNLGLAIESGQRAVDISPNKAANNEALGLIYENASFYTRGALEWAEKYYNKEIELDPNNPTPYLRIALIKMAQAKNEKDASEKEYYVKEAIKKYDEALEKKNDLASAYYGKAIAYEKLNNLDKSIEELKNATIFSRNNLDYYFELGRLYFNRGVSQSSIQQDATKKITENDINSNIKNQNKTASGTEAEKLSVKPIKATGSGEEFNDDLRRAEQIFLGIISRQPKHANSLYSLALLYQKTGKTEKAKAMVKKLLNILQDSGSKEMVKQQFKGLY